MQDTIPGNTAAAIHRTPRAAIEALAAMLEENEICCGHSR